LWSIPLIYKNLSYTLDLKIENEHEVLNPF
jgi:hypothetical protein